MGLRCKFFGYFLNAVYEHPWLCIWMAIRNRERGRGRFRIGMEAFASYTDELNIGSSSFLSVASGVAGNDASMTRTSRPSTLAE